MRAPWKSYLARALFAVFVLGGCAATGPPTSLPSRDQPPPATPSAIGHPLVLDRADFRLGTTVQFSRVPSANELYELQQITGLAHVVLTLDAWPATFAQIEALRSVPPEADLMVVLRGYPPTREASEAWNLVEVRQRLILLVEGPPPSPIAVADLNAMRGLERVVVQTDQPSRAGFERLQRPLSFRVLRP